MPKFVWKSLKSEDMEKLLGYLEGLPESERPLYGLTGQKPTFLTAGSATWTHAVHFTADRVVITDATSPPNKKTTSHDLGDLLQVDAKKPRLGEFGRLKLGFRDGSSLELMQVSKTQCEPVEALLGEGPAAFARERLSDTQLTNCYYAYDLAGVIPPDLLKKK
jgi:hypothetical protein